VKVPQHAILTGGSSGIGLALAARLATSSWRLTILARDPGRLAAAQAHLKAAGAEVLARSVDVVDSAQLASAVAEATDALGPPALAIACAGIVRPLPFAAQSLTDFRRSMDVNYFGSLHLARAALPGLRTTGGRLVLVASGAALIGFYGYSSYAPAKFAVRGLAEALRSELAPEGVAVSVVFPPDTDTPGFRAEQLLRPEATSRIAGTGRVLTADQVAAAIQHGLARGHFAITPGATMTALWHLHSLVGPLLHRLWFDRIVQQSHLTNPPSA
jgi:3-dehydrosphinganine reductase